MLSPSTIGNYWAFKPACDECPLFDAYVEAVLRQETTDDETPSFEAYDKLKRPDKDRLDELLEPPNNEIGIINGHHCKKPAKILGLFGKAICRGNIAVIESTEMTIR